MKDTITNKDKNHMIELFNTYWFYNNKNHPDNEQLYKDSFTLLQKILQRFAYWRCCQHEC